MMVKRDVIVGLSTLGLGVVSHRVRISIYFRSVFFLRNYVQPFDRNSKFKSSTLCKNGVGGEVWLES